MASARYVHATNRSNMRRSIRSQLVLYWWLLVASSVATVPVNAFATSPTMRRRSFSSRASFQPVHTRLYAKKKKKKNAGNTVIATNRLAYRNYEILETLEAGISLLGTEVKAIRQANSINLRDGYCKATNAKSLALHNVHISKCRTAGTYFQHEERRIRPLLLHRQQVRKWYQQLQKHPGMTIVPLQAYYSSKNTTDNRKPNVVKLKIALCRGKTLRDKRATIQERQAKRDERRIIKSFRI